MAKPTPPFETPLATTALTAPELPLRLQNGLSTPPPDRLTNGTNGVLTPQASKPKFICPPLPNTVPLKFSKETVADLQLLTPEEREVCSVLRIMPKPYLAIKEAMMREAMVAE